VLEAVIFDFDGVIIDSVPYYFKYMRQYLKDYNTDISDDDIVHLVGYPFAQKIHYLNKTYNLGVSKEEFVARTYDDMRREMHENIQCPENLKSLLNQLKEKDIEMAIASSNSKKNVTFYIEKFGITDYFAHVVTLDHVAKPKPEPDTYIEVIKRIQKNAANCVAIEDTIIGVESAVSAGLKAVALPNKFTLNHDFSKAHLIIHGFEGLSVEKLEELVK